MNKPTKISNTSHDEGKKILIYSLPLILILLGYAFPTLLVLKKPNVAFLEFFFSFLAMMTFPIYKFTKSYKVAGHYLVCNGFVVIVGLILLTGGLHGPSGFWLTLFPFMASLVLGKEYLKIYAFFTFLSIITLHGLDKEIINLPFSIKDPEYIKSARMRTIYAMFFFTFIMSQVYESVISEAYKNMALDKKKIQSLLRLISHDLCNYLFVIKNKVNKLKKSTQIQEEKEKSAIIKVDENLESIISLLNHVREVEALKSGKYQVELECVDLNDSLDNSLAIFESQLLEKNIDVKRAFLPKVFIKADKICLETQVFNNIFSNAIKFCSKNGKIEIDGFQDGNSFYLKIADNGIGMNKELIQNVFSEYMKTTRKGTFGEKGTGFGMPLVKNYIESFGGQVFVESKCISENPDKHGTTVTLSFVLYEKESLKEDNIYLLKG